MEAIWNVVATVLVWLWQHPEWVVGYIILSVLLALFVGQAARLGDEADKDEEV